MSQNIDALLFSLVASIEYIRALNTNNNFLATYNIQNQPIEVRDGQVNVTHQPPIESFASRMQRGDILVPSSDISHQFLHNVLTNYSPNPSSEVQPAHASGSTFQLHPHPPPAPLVDYTCKIGVGCSLPLESTTRSIRSHLREHGYVHKDRERASCPWQGCGKEMRWTNVSRHIKEAHLGDRLPCRKCGKMYTRKETLDAHTKKCN